ncbi:MAG: WhiB family transcriptional regulator [Rhodococcus sp. (in: high G+C Gram-positive bacteria)]
MARCPLRKALEPCTGHWDWQLDARCRYLDPDMFFARDNESKPVRIRRERAAKEICYDCPVRVQCRAHALSVGESYGVWGGTTEADRRNFSRHDTGDGDEHGPVERRPLRVVGLYRSPRTQGRTESVGSATG